MAYNFDQDISTENYTIQIDTFAHYGSFEHKIYGDRIGGGLWFDEQNMLIDYDGVYELPKQVKDSLVKHYKIYPDQIENF